MAHAACWSWLWRHCALPLLAALRELDHWCHSSEHQRCAGTGLQQPGQGNYLGNDPEGIHFISTPLDLPCMAHELGHLAEMGTYG